MHPRTARMSMAEAVAPAVAREAVENPPQDDRRRVVSFGEAFRFWLKLGFINFGGPAGQIAIMHRELVDQKRWVPEGVFLRALNFCMLLPGPEAQQLAIYIGWRLHGMPGGIVAGSLFVIPSIFVLLALSWLAVSYGDVPVVRGLLYGIQPVVTAIVLDAVIRVGRRTLRHRLLIGFAAAAFVALYVARLPFPFVIVGAALGGVLLQRRWPGAFRPSGHGQTRAHETQHPTTSAASKAPPSLRGALQLLAIFLALWTTPFALLMAWRGWQDVLTQEMWFFTQAAFITFGGAYAVLSFTADIAVNSFQWVTTPEMVRGLGLAESTPGPLIMVTEYVGFLAAWKNTTPGVSPAINGTLGALIAVYATFLPSFFFIFIGAPFIELLSGNRRLEAALTGITAAVVGVIANLGVFFALHVLFPGSGGFDWFATVLATASFGILRRFATPTYVLVPLGAVLGMAWVLITAG